MVLRRVGHGGMGSVYSAYDEALGRRVAIKLLQPERRTKQARRIRMRREAQAMAQVSHPNVVQVFEVGEYRGQTFIAMEFVEGETLEAWQMQSGHTQAEILAAYRQAGAGLAAAHRAGVLHRDFKATNALVDDDGRVRVTDFGLAAWLRPSEPTDTGELPPLGVGATEADESTLPRLTRPGSILGTPAFMSPEQYRQQPLDARSDQFSFCIALYEGLTGQHPFGGGSIEQMREAILAGRLREEGTGRSLAPALRRAIHRGLAADPSDRWPSMDALLEALSPAPRGRGRLAWWSMGAAGLGLAAASYAVITRGSDLCHGAAQASAMTWNVERRAQARQGLASTGHPLAEPTWERVDGRMGTYVDEWNATRTRVCEATQLHGEQSAALMDQRMACLDLRLDAVASLLDRFADADVETVLHAVDAVARLPELRSCERAEAEAGAATPTLDMDPEAVELRRRLIDAQALLDVGHFEAAIDQLGAIEIEADTRRLAPVAALARVERGHAEHEAGRVKEADQSLENGMWAALAAHDDHTAFEAAIEHTTLVGVVFVDRQRGFAGVERAHALLRRLGEPDRLRIDYLVSAGAVLGRHGRTREARALLEEALELAAHVYGTEHTTYAAALNTAGMVALWSDDFDEAQRRFETVLELDERLFAPTHVAVASPLNNLAVVMANKGDFPAAAARFHQAYEIRRGALGEHHVLVGDSLMNNAGIALQLQQFEPALRDLARAREIYAQSLGPGAPKLIDADLARGVLLVSLERDGEAEAIFRDVLADQRKQLGEHHPDLVQTLESLGQLLVRTGRPGEAIELLGEAIELERENLVAAAADPSRAPSMRRLKEHLAEAVAGFDPTL